VIGRYCTDAELERLRQQLTHCETKLERVQRELHEQKDSQEDFSHQAEMEAMRER